MYYPLGSVVITRTLWWGEGVARGSKLAVDEARKRVQVETMWLWVRGLMWAASRLQKR